MGNQSYLAKPVMINGKEIKNRIVLPAMADFGMTGPDGLVNERHIERYGAYAKGGTGLIIIEACAVTELPETRGTIGLYSSNTLYGLSALAKAAKVNGAVALVQIMNTGLHIMPEKTIAEMSREKFQQYKEDFVTAAKRCKSAGFDGIELHAAHGMYLDQIIETSQRKDEYGGSFENRVRIVVELIQEIKAACGQDFIISVRFGNPNQDELLKTAAAIEKAGADLLDVSTGMHGYPAPSVNFPWDNKIYAAARVKRNAHIPVICVGGVVSGWQAEEILRGGYADMVAVGRGHLCDPEWANKAMRGEEPIPCRRCRNCMWYEDGRKCPAVRQRGGDTK